MPPRRSNLNFVKFLKKQVKPSNYFAEKDHKELHSSISFYGGDEAVSEQFIKDLLKLKKYNNEQVLLLDIPVASSANYFFTYPELPDFKVEDFMVARGENEDPLAFYHIVDGIEFSVQTGVFCDAIELLLKNIKDLVDTYKAKYPNVKFSEAVESFPEIYARSMELIATYRSDAEKLSGSKIAHMETIIATMDKNPEILLQATRIGGGPDRFHIMNLGMQHYLDNYSKSRRSKKLGALRRLISTNFNTPFNWRNGRAEQQKYLKLLNAESGNIDIVNFSFVFSKLVEDLIHGIYGLSDSIRKADRRSHYAYGRLYDFWSNYFVARVIRLSPKFPGGTAKIEKIIEYNLGKYRQHDKAKKQTIRQSSNKKILELVKIIDIEPEAINVSDTNAPAARPGITKRVNQCAKDVSLIAGIQPERDDIDTIKLSLKRADSQEKIDLIINNIFETIEDCCAIADSFSELSEQTDDTEE